MLQSQRGGMAELSINAVRKCWMASSSRYATRCCTSYGSCTFACQTSIRRVVPCTIPCWLRGASWFSVSLGQCRGVSIILRKEPSVTSGSLPMSSSKIAGVIQSEYAHEKVNFRHSTIIFCDTLFRGRDTLFRGPFFLQPNHIGHSVGQ